MVDPRIYNNPYRPPRLDTISKDVHRQNLAHAAAGLIPRGAVPEVMPSDGRLVKLVACLKCCTKKVPYVFAPRNRVYRSDCRGCGQPHVFHPKGLAMDVVQREGAVKPLGPEFDYKGTPTVDATKAWQELKRKRELGPAYWRNPK